DDLWFASFGTTDVVRVDLTAGAVAQTVDVLNEPRDVVVAGDAVWVAANKSGVGVPGSVVRIDPDAGKVTASVTTRRWIHSLAADRDTLWASNFDDGTLSVIDATDATVVATTPIGDRPGGVAFGHGSVWVTPHRRPALVRIDPTQPLEAAAEPDVARAVDVTAGTVFIHCSGSGSPTVVLEAGIGGGIGSWAIVEARLSRRTRVCAYDRVGVADESQAGQAGAASTIAADLGAALDAVDAHPPYLVVGETLGALYAEMFAATRGDAVAGLVLIDPTAPDFYDRVRPLLTLDDLARMDHDLSELPELRWLDETEAEVSGIAGFGELPLVVVSSDPIAAGAPNPAVGELITATRREQAERSEHGTFVQADGNVAAADVVEAVLSLLG
ncbi:MAG TPA: alpha/beta fold hydrolase, partial [Ilumatobacter sp.]|nr:alpha/beta fold hydrolase [Ilumatobacter sp.]